MSDIVTRLNRALEGRYEIERELGAGGMATVYLAKDLRHNRHVALKVLKPELAAVVGAERFLAEIETTANLQHPHILPLFDSGEADSFLFYAMPYVEGETLRDRLEREKQLPVDEAVRIATDVAEALHAAHERGVIHRDVKPANILLSRGRPLVADFGIALAVSAAGGGRLTETGLSMGTPYYMSPEQASADRDPSGASDVYSLGCVLYEMLVGEPPHVGSSAQAVLAKILTHDAPAPTAARSSIPANVDAAIRKSLEKLPADRFADAQGFARALGDPLFRLDSDATAAVLSSGRWSRIGPAMTGVASVALGLALWGWLRPAPVQPVTRYELMPPGGPEASVDIGAFDLSPDGGWLVYGGAVRDEDTPQIWVKAQDQAVWVPLPGTEGGFLPRVSPDGTRIAYIDARQGDLRVVPVLGGASTRLTAVAGPFAWLDTESLIVTAPGRDELRRIGASGGGSETIWASDSLVAWGIPSTFANGAGVLVAMCEACPVDLTLFAIDVAAGDARAVYPALYGQYAQTGDLVLVDVSGSVLAGPFDPGRRELTGDVVPILEGVSTGNRQTGFIMSESGTAITVLGPPARADITQTLYEPVWVSRDGTETLAVEGWKFQLSFNFGHALSPDASRLAIGLQSDAGADVWIKELPDGPLTRLTLDPEDDARPTWSADGAYIWHQSGRGGDGLKLYRRRADGADAPQSFPTPGRDAQQAEPSPDGAWMVARVDGSLGGAETGRDIVAYRTDGDSTEVPLLVTDYDEYSPSLSPDGRWLAYVSTESGRPEVYVRPFPDVDEGRWQVSNDGGIQPLWKGDGTEIYYVTGSGRGPTAPGRVMTAAAVETTSTFSVRSREPLFELPRELLTTAPWEPVVDVDPDGSRFFMMRRVPDPSEQETYHLILVENFLEELKARVPK